MSSLPPRTLYRPVGLFELERILEDGARGFPPRLPGQPFFYPVLAHAYAEQIARDWNAPDAGSGHAGFVTAFEVDAAYVARFEERVVGASVHRELWVPAAELPRFNAHLRSRVRVTRAFYGEHYAGPAPGALGEGDPRRQLGALAALLAVRPLDVRAHAALVWANFALWTEALVEHGPGEARRALELVRVQWATAFPEVPLPEAR
jgi:hypothetical protein